MKTQYRFRAAPGAILLGALALAACQSAPQASVQPTINADSVKFLAAAIIPGGSAAKADKSGLPHELLEDGQSWQDSLDGIGSGFCYTGAGDRYLALCDRGPNKVQYKGGEGVDFTTSYRNRFQVLDLKVRQEGGAWKADVSLVGTTLLKNEAGENFIGISKALAASDPAKNLRLDSEGIRVAPDGSVWISDEYGPVVYRFDRTGKRVESLPLPASFKIVAPALSLAAEMADPANASGRYTNRGAEGLALTPDGRTLVVAMQSALVQDGGQKGLGTRFLAYDLSKRGAAPKQFVYVCDSTKTAVSEILAVNAHQFIVDERDGVAGPKGIKLLYLVDLAQAPAATDASSVAKLALDGTAPGLVPLRKTLLADLGAVLNAAAPYATEAGLPDKIEGLAFGPDLPDGRHLLLATNDNDYASTFPNYIFAFAVEKAALPDFKPFAAKTGF